MQDGVKRGWWWCWSWRLKDDEDDNNDGDDDDDNDDSGDADDHREPKGMSKTKAVFLSSLSVFRRMSSSLLLSLCQDHQSQRTFCSLSLSLSLMNDWHSTMIMMTMLMLMREFRQRMIVIKTDAVDVVVNVALLFVLLEFVTQDRLSSVLSLCTRRLRDNNTERHKLFLTLKL